MAWVENDTINAMVWVMGPYLPTSPSLLQAIPADLFPPDAGEIELVLLPPGSDPATEYTGAWWYNAYRYNTGSGFRDQNVFDDGLELWVIFYNITATVPFTPSVADGSSFVPPEYALGGTAGGGAPPPSNDLFADRFPLLGRCGQMTVADLNTATTEVWESHIGDGHTAWWQWVAPFTGWILFRSPLGELVPRLWQDPITDGEPTPFGTAEIYADEHMAWAYVTVGQNVYLQLDVDFDATGGTLSWQQLVDQPEHVENVTSDYIPAATTTIPDTDGYPKGFGPGGYGSYPQALQAVDDQYISFQSPAEVDFVEYGGLGLGTAAVTTFTPDTSPLADDAVLDGWGWTGQAQFTHINSTAYIASAFRWSGGDKQLIDQTFHVGAIGSTLFSPGPVVPDLTGIPSMAMLQAGDFELVIGLQYPYQGVVLEFLLNYVVVTISWHHTVGLPVPPWSCGMPPLRMRQRDDGLSSSVLRHKKPSSRQGTLRHRGYI